MIPLSIFGLFCEDIREESGNSFSIIGTLPDNINVQAPNKPSADNSLAATLQNKVLTKLCVFARANFDPNDSAKKIQLSLVLPDDTRIPIGGVDPEIMEAAKRQAKDKKLPIAGVVMRAILVGFRLPKSGLLRLEATIDSETRLLAALNFVAPDQVTSPSEPPQPSSQSSDVPQKKVS